MLTRLPSTQHCKDHRGRFRIPEEVEDPCQDSTSPSCSRPDLRQWLRKCSGPRVVVRQRYSHFHKPPGRKQEWSTNRTISLKVPAAAFFFSVSTNSSAYKIWSLGIPVAAIRFDQEFQWLVPY